MRWVKCGPSEVSGPDYLRFITEDLFLSHVKDADSPNFSKLHSKILVKYIIIWHGNYLLQVQKIYGMAGSNACRFGS